MAVTEKFSLWAFSKVTVPVLCRPVPALLFWTLIKQVTQDLELKGCEYKVTRLMYVF